MATSQNSRTEQEGRTAVSEQDELSLFEVMGSVLAAGFGVQSKENKVRDFTRGKPGHFIAAGIVFTLALLASLIAVVSLVV